MGNTFGNSPRYGEYDAVIIGSGPNGLAAAICLARAGASVLVIEGKGSIGGGMRSAELIESGCIHDVCSAVHPMGVASPFFRSLDLGRHGLEWLHPEFPVAHPLDNGSAAIVSKSLKETVERLGPDGTAYHNLVSPLLGVADHLFEELLGPLPFPPKHPVSLGRFGIHAVQSAVGLARNYFSSDVAQGLFMGHAAHSILPLDKELTAAVGTLFCVSTHHAGWPVAKGGSQKIADALAAYLISKGGEIVVDAPVHSLEALPKASAYLFDTGPKAMATICGKRLPAPYISRLEKYRYGPGTFKLDFLLSEQIPWKNADARKAGTVHLGGTLEQIAESERRCWTNSPSAKPFVLVAQQSVCDNTRTPDNRHTGWAYCHVPNGYSDDMTESILQQIERFAPGFRDTILATHTMSPQDFQTHNPNYVGGDVIGGAQDIFQMFTRPVARWDPYTTPAKDIFLCSASTPPGGGVHGMCGLHAAASALKRM